MKRLSRRGLREKVRAVIRIERHVVIGRPAEDVFEFVEDPSRHSLWQSTLVESRLLTDGPIGVGTRVREARRFLGVGFEITWEVTEYRPSTWSSVRLVAGPIPGSASYLLEPVDDGTKLTVAGEVDAKHLFSFGDSIFKRMAGRELGANLGRLKDLLESPVPALQ